MSTVAPGIPGHPPIAPGFKTPLRIELGENGLWVLLEDLVWVGTDGDTLIVRAGEETDFASVPRWLQALLPSADPRVVRAAVVHDFLCRELNDWHRAVEQSRFTMDEAMQYAKVGGVPRPIFSSTDADAIFKKIMADEGAGWWMQNIGWVGVRLGAAVSPARRPGWQSTAWPVLWRLTLFLCLAAVIAAGVAWAVPW